MFKKIFLPFLLIIFGSICYAQDVATSIGPQVGFHKAADADNGQLMYGAAIRVKFTEALGFEGSLNYRQEDYRDGAITISQWPVMLSGLFYPTPNIFGIAGVGWYNTKIEFENSLVDLPDRTSQEFGWHFGAGVDIPLGESAAITSDFRYVFIDYNFEEVPGTDEIQSNFFVIKAGLMFVIN